MIIKKILSVLCCIFVIFVFSSCSTNNEEKVTTESKNEIVNENLTEATNVTESTNKDWKEKEEVDIDLSQMSKTMMYSELYNLLSEPHKYLGQKIRIAGDFAVYHDGETGLDYYSCLLSDATVCCTQVLEFVLKDGKYPEPNEKITVEGYFDTYMENGTEYCHLVKARLC